MFLPVWPDKAWLMTECQVSSAASYLWLFTMHLEGTLAVISPLNSLTSHTTSASLDSVGNVGVPSESHLSLKAIPDLSAVCRALHCEGHQQANGGRTCQLSHCALNTYELYWEHVSAHVHYSHLTPVFCFFFVTFLMKWCTLFGRRGQICPGWEMSCLFMIVCPWMLKRRL